MQYRLYFMSPGSTHITSSHEFLAEDDERATRIAEAWLEGRSAELWTGARRVKHWAGSR